MTGNRALDTHTFTASFNTVELDAERLIGRVEGGGNKNLK